MNDSSLIKRDPNTILSLVTIFLIVLIDILAANVLSAVGLYQAQHKIERRYRIQHDLYHHSLAPNIKHSDAKWGAMGYRVDTNALGFKDNAARRIDLNHSNRILFIGDSFTEGVGFEYDDTFVGILAKALEKEGTEVLNAGVSSYSPIIYLRKVEHLLQEVKLEFRHLVVFIDISDIYDEARAYTFDKNRNVVDAQTAKSKEWDERIKNFIAENTIVINTLRVWIRTIKKSGPSQKKSFEGLNQYKARWTYDAEAFSDYGEAGLQAAETQMSALASLLKMQGIKLTVAVYPWPDQILEKDLQSHQVLFWKKWAIAHESGFINLFPAFIGKENPEETLLRYFIWGDVHWNKAGHQRVAEHLLPYLNE